MMKGRLFLACSVAAALSAPAGAQQLGGGGGGDVSIVRVFLALLFCLVIAVLAALVIRQRLGGRAPDFTRVLGRIAPTASRIRLVESRRISPQGELCIAEVDGDEYLLLLSAGGPLMLDRKVRPVSFGNKFR